MHLKFRKICKLLAIVASGSVMVFAQQAMAQTPGSVQQFRGDFGALLDGYEQVFRQEGDARGVQWIAQAKAAMLVVSDAEISKVFSVSGIPDMTSAHGAIQRVVTGSQRALQTGKRQKAGPFPGSPSVISSCNDTPHGDQITYDALIAFQVTSGILEAAAWVCSQDVLGANGASVCIPLAIANDVASSLFAVRNFCSGLDTSALVQGTYDRLTHMHTDVGTAQTTIVNATTASTKTITDSVSSNSATINSNINANTTNLINTGNNNTASVIDFMLRTQIEANLAADGRSVGLYVTPGSKGGKLERVRSIVVDTIANLAAPNKKEANDALEAGDVYYAAGNYKKSYESFQKAYRAAIK